MFIQKKQVQLKKNEPDFLFQFFWKGFVLKKRTKKVKTFISWKVGSQFHQLWPNLTFFLQLKFYFQEEDRLMAVVVAQLVERLLPTQEIYSSNPKISKIFLPIVHWKRRDKNKEKEARNGPFLKKEGCLSFASILILVSGCTLKVVMVKVLWLAWSRVINLVRLRPGRCFS